MVSSIRRVTDGMGEIGAASTEKGTGVAQVGEAITQMDQATQQNAALKGRSAAAAECLKGQAPQLVQAVAVFRLSHGEPALSAATAHRPRNVAPVRKTRPVHGHGHGRGNPHAHAPAHAASIPTAHAVAQERRGPDWAQN